MKDKEYIPNTNPDWDLELPDGDRNSLVDKYGRNHDDGYNFDEKDDEEEEEVPKFDPEAAKKAREEVDKNQEL